MTLRPRLRAGRPSRGRRLGWTLSVYSADRATTLIEAELNRDLAVLETRE
jgi:hypothetical protein